MKTASESKKWDFSRRLRPSTAIDFVDGEFVILNEYGKKDIAIAGRDVNQAEMIDNLPIQVAVKWNGHEFIIMDWNEIDHHKSYTGQLELSDWS